MWIWEHRLSLYGGEATSLTVDEVNKPKSF